MHQSDILMLDGQKCFITSRFACLVSEHQGGAWIMYSVHIVFPQRTYTSYIFSIRNMNYITNLNSAVTQIVRL